LQNKKGLLDGGKEKRRKTTMLATFLMTCHNRSESAEGCALSIGKYLPDNILAHLVVVIDHCTDDTEERLKYAWRGTIDVIKPKEEAFWAGGMKIAETHALKLNPDFLVWINEDMVITSDMSPLFDPNRITVAKILVDGEGDTPQKGLLTNLTSNKVKYRKTVAGEQGTTFNGNLVSIPKTFYPQLSIYPYSHSMADIDYGLQASRLGFPIEEVDVTAVTSKPQRKDWRYKDSWRARLKGCLHPTGLPP
jgi:hypothetical protein